MAATAYCALSSALQEYVQPAVEFLKAKSKIPTFTGCLVHAGCDTSSRFTGAAAAELVLLVTLLLVVLLALSCCCWRCWWR